MRLSTLFLALPLLFVFHPIAWAADAPAVNGKIPGNKTAVTGSGEVLFNFQDVDIQAVVKTVSKLTGRNFILDPRVKGKITIISAHAVSRSAAYQIFLSALKAQGFTAVSSAGGVTKIIPLGEGKQSAATGRNVSRIGGDQMITEVIVVQNGEATQLIPLLRPLMAPTSQLSAYTPANALVITDFAQNVRRLARIIGDIDQPITSEVTVIPLQHASALDLGEMINQLTANRSGGPKNIVTSKVAIIPDLRTNSLLVRAGNPGQLTQLKSLIAKLDVAARAAGTTRVVYLRNAEAKKLAEVLQGLMKAKPAGGKTKSAESHSFIQADEATNALIINAPDAEYNNLRAVIEKLDIRRAQVYVEALIAEVTSSKTSELGFQWAAAGGVGGGGVAGGMINFPNSGSGIAAVASDTTGTAAAGLGGFSLAYLGPEVDIGGGQMVRGLGALANALEATTKANILSTPNVLTLDNAEAKIVVGQNVPFLTGSFAQAAGTSGSTVNPFQTIERKDVGLTLKIKPQISEGGTIKMEIFQEVSDVSLKPIGGATDLVTDKRTLETTVVIDDGHTIVLGGLIKDKADNSRSRVPGLGAIPIIGALFRYKKKVKEKTNLMIFLRPTIIRTIADSNRLTIDRYDHLMERSRRFSKDQLKIMDKLKPATPKMTPTAPEETSGTPKADKEAKEEKKTNNQIEEPSAEP